MNNSEQEKETSNKTSILPIILLGFLLLIVICGILTLIGPQIGNVFSRIGDCTGSVCL